MWHLIWGLIFRMIDHVYKIYWQLTNFLGDDAIVKAEEGVHEVDRKLIGMYHGATSKSVQKRITEKFPPEDSHMRCMVATSAFGMGVQVSHVKNVVHWWASRSSARLLAADRSWWKRRL